MKNVITIIMFIALAIIFADGIQPQGNGTEENPYLVESLDNLLWITTNEDSWDSHFLQTNDIDASDTENWNEGHGWDPIGTYNDDTNTGIPFSGIYNGGNYSISNLHIHRENEEYIAMFEYIYNSVVLGVNLSDVVITGGYSNKASSLIGLSETSNISNCSSSGEMQRASGLIASALNSSIDYCHTSLIIEYTSAAGGLINGAAGSRISNCYSEGEMVGASNYNASAGGVIHGAGDSQIINCHSSMDLVSENICGGIAVIARGEVLNCYFEGSIEAENNYGGIILNQEANIRNSYYNYETTTINGEHLLSVGAINNLMYTEWMDNNMELDADNYLDNDDGIYLINDEEDFFKLQFFGLYDYRFKLNNNLNLTDYPNQFIPFFKGNFNGDNHSIDNLYIDYQSNNGVGLFAVISNSIIENVNVTNSNIINNRRSGILASSIYSTEIMNSRFSGEVYGNSYIGGVCGTAVESDFNNININVILTGGGKVGGIAGDLYYSSASKIKGDIEINTSDTFYASDVGGFSGCLSYSNISNLNFNVNFIIEHSINNIGGITGFCNYSQILNSSSSGIIEGNGQEVGGLVGYAFSENAIKNCYSRVNVSGVLNVGGLIGVSMENNDVRNCYSTGQTSSIADTASGLIAYSIPNTVHYCFWDIESSSNTYSYDGIPRTTVEMQNVETFTNLPEAWDFVDNPFNDNQNNNYWSINLDVNDGYPNLLYNYVTQIDDDYLDDVTPVNVVNIKSLYPNPFNPTTTISYELCKSSNVQVDIFNIKGQKIMTSKEGTKSSGNHVFIWNGTNINDKRVASGLYLFKISSESQKCLTKGILIK